MAIWDELIPESDRKMFEKAGMGKLGGFGKNPAVIVVDMTYAFVDERFPLGSPTGPAAAEAIKGLLKVARSKKVPIVYSTGAHREKEAENHSCGSGYRCQGRKSEIYSFFYQFGCDGIRSFF